MSTRCSVAVITIYSYFHYLKYVLIGYVIILRFELQYGQIKIQNYDRICQWLHLSCSTCANPCEHKPSTDYDSQVALFARWQNSQFSPDPMDNLKVKFIILKIFVFAEKFLHSRIKPSRFKTWPWKQTYMVFWYFYLTTLTSSISSPPNGLLH